MFDLDNKLTVEGYGSKYWSSSSSSFSLSDSVSFLQISQTTASSSSPSPSAAGVFVPLNSHLDKQTLKYNLGLFDPDKPESPSYAGSFGLIWVKETQVIPGLSGLSSQMQLQFLSM
ncbi:hypothetical protein NC651_039071 [Populus alba x Populus x berolinensis]|nr:hypothetical protein NC651_039071 [Populus alba x Populus x berolinensis]